MIMRTPAIILLLCLASSSLATAWKFYNRCDPRFIPALQNGGQYDCADPSSPNPYIGAASLYTLFATVINTFGSQIKFQEPTPDVVQTFFRTNPSFAEAKFNEIGLDFTQFRFPSFETLVGYIDSDNAVIGGLLADGQKILATGFSGNNIVGLDSTGKKVSHKFNLFYPDWAIVFKPRSEREQAFLP